jgi:hypothetical protein
MSRQNILRDAGKISAELAKEKAEKEYEIYKEKSYLDLSDVERHFIDSIDEAEKKILKKFKK